MKEGDTGKGERGEGERERGARKGIGEGGRRPMRIPGSPLPSLSSVLLCKCRSAVYYTNVGHTHTVGAFFYSHATHTHIVLWAVGPATKYLQSTQTDPCHTDNAGQRSGGRGGHATCEGEVSVAASRLALSCLSLVLATNHSIGQAQQCRPDAGTGGSQEAPRRRPEARGALATTRKRSVFVCAWSAGMRAWGRSGWRQSEAD